MGTPTSSLFSEPRRDSSSSSNASVHWFENLGAVRDNRARSYKKLPDEMPDPPPQPPFSNVSPRRRDSRSVSPRGTRTSSSLGYSSPAARPSEPAPFFSTMPHPRETNTSPRVSVIDTDETHQVAEITAKFRLAIPRRGSGSSASSSIDQGGDAAEERRRSIGEKMAEAVEQGNVIVTPASKADEAKIRQVQRQASGVRFGEVQVIPSSPSSDPLKKTTSGKFVDDQAVIAQSAGSAMTRPIREPPVKEGNRDERNMGQPRPRASDRTQSETIPGSPKPLLKRNNATVSNSKYVDAVLMNKPESSKMVSTQIDGLGERRVSHAALLRLPPHTAAVKSQALMGEGPQPRRRRSSSKSRKDSAGTVDLEAEDNEWDEESLLNLTDWWRQALAAGATPSQKEMDMMDSFLGDFLEEEMPRQDMVLRTRLHRLLVAINDGAEIRGEGEDEERFHELARKAGKLERSWMKATKGRLFAMERERRELMFSPHGRLAMLEFAGSHGLEPTWRTERNYRAGMGEATPGEWWLNSTCAYRDGIIGSIQSFVTTAEQHAHPTLVLEVGQENPTDDPAVTVYTHEGPLRQMLLRLLVCLDKQIRVLRNWTLKSKLAPVAGLRFDGWYKVLSYSHKRISTDEDLFRVIVNLERVKGQTPMVEILTIPLPSMLDEWEEYMAIRDEEMRQTLTTGQYEEWHRRERERELSKEEWLMKLAEEEARVAQEKEAVDPWLGYN